MRRMTEALAITIAIMLAVGCGGGAGTIHGTIDDAADRIDESLAALEDAREEIDEAMLEAGEPCAEPYERPRSSPRFRDQFPMPEALEGGGNLRTQYNLFCQRAEQELAMLRAGFDMTVEMLERFERHADAMHDVVSDELSAEDLESISAEVQAITDARPDEDTVQRRYQIVEDRLLATSPYLRETLNVAAEQQVIPAIMGGRWGRERQATSDDLTTTFRLHLNSDAERIAEDMTKIRDFLDEYEAAREYRRVDNEYQRNIHEGPDAAR